MPRIQPPAKWLQVVALVVGICGGLVALGVTMPWNALARAEAAEQYETKSDAKSKDKLAEARFKAIWHSLNRIEKKLDKLTEK